MAENQAPQTDEGDDLIHQAMGASDQSDAAPVKTNQVLPPSKQTPDELLRTLKMWWSKDGAHARRWRDGDKLNMGAKESYDFLANRQWTEDELTYLETQKRPPVTFNRTLPTIAAVKGIEINSRQQITYLPTTGKFLDQRGQIMVEANETLTAASKSFADECDAEDEESEAFGDALTCGMGWVEPRVDYDENPMGAYAENAMNPLECAWDFRARKKNLIDRQRQWHLRPMALHEAQGLFPDADPDDLNCSWARSEVDASETHVDEYGVPKDRPIDGNEIDPNQEVHVLRVQWWEHEQVMIVAHPGAPKPVMMKPDEFAAFSSAFKMAQEKAAQLGHPFPPNAQISAKPGKRKRYFEAYIGRVLLDGPKPPQYGAAPNDPEQESGFTWHCITGLPDKIRGHWFGLVAVMKDPQKWANAWVSQTQHILNTTAKGGVIAEEDAFVDTAKAQEDYARPDSIVFVQRGAIAGNKLMQKPGVGITAGHANLVQLAISSIRDVTGVNLEILGMREANQPGVLEAQRKQASMTILAPWFDSHRRFRKLIGRNRLYYIQHYLAQPDRFVRVAGDSGYKLIPLLKNNVIGRHDVVVSDAPQSPNRQQEYWENLEKLIPLMMEDLKTNPELAIALIKFCPGLPAEFRDLYVKIKSQGPSPIAQAQMALTAKGAMSKIGEQDARAGLFKAQADAAKAQAGDMEADTLLKIVQGIAAFNAERAADANTQASERNQAYLAELTKWAQAMKAINNIATAEDAPDVVSANPSAMPGAPQPPQLPHLPIQGGQPPGPIGPQPMPPVAPPFINGAPNAQ